MNKRIQFQESFSSPEAPTVILFHGFGANMHDLAGLQDILTPEGQQLNWIFPNGPYSVPTGPDWDGRAWWPLQLSKLPNDWSDITPAELPLIQPLLDDFFKSLNRPWSQIILGGFSQGAMLATDLYLNAPETPLGLISFSGSLIRKNVWIEKIKNRANEKVFLSHGEQDPVLPIRGTQALMELMKKNQLVTEFVPFRGQHEIPMNVCERAQKYIAEKVKKL